LTIGSLLLVFCGPARGDEGPLERASRLNQEVSALHKQGKYIEAIPLAKKVLRLTEKALGPDHPAVATVLSNLAVLLHSIGDYAEARPLLERALKIREKVLRPDHPDVGLSLNNLAGLLEATGDYAAAKPLYERALEINEQALGPDHPAVGLSLNNLAGLLVSIGDYAKARPLLERALKIAEEVVGPDHPDVANRLNNLANLLHLVGDTAAARQLYERSLRIREKALGANHPAVRLTLHELAILLWSTGNWGDAKPLLVRAHKIAEKALGPDHPDVATELNNLVNLLLASDTYVALRPLCERALRIRERAFGPDHPDVATSAATLAKLFWFAGDYGEARPLLQRALRIYETCLGPDHPRVATVLGMLATLFETTGDHAAAKPLVRRAEAIVHAHLDRTSGALSPKQKLAMVSGYRVHLDSLVCNSIRSVAPTDVEAIWRWKGRVAEVLASERAAVLSSDDSKLASLFDKLAAQRRELALFAFSTPGPGGAAKSQSRMNELEAKIEELEVILAHDSAALSSQIRLRNVSSKQIQAALPKGALLIDYLRYSHITLNPKTHKVDMEDRYLAVYVAGAEFGIVHLGSAKKIESAVGSFRKAVSQLNVSEERIQATGGKLRKLVLEPVLSKLSTRPSSLIVAPDAALHTVPVAALPGETSGTYLIQEYQISYASSGKDLVRWQVRGPPNESSLAVGDPDFTLTSVRGAAGTSRGEGMSTCVNENWRQEISRLPGTRSEATEVSRLFPGNERDGHLLLDKDAAEAKVKELMQSARFVHLATHGFFFSGECGESTREKTRGLGVKARLQLELNEGRMPLAQVENPLLLSGLLLAGAAVAAPTGGDDGVLTAAEVMNLDLSGTELVTLSACETGLGEVKAGEGVMGLRSAFLTAGARSLLLSLWKVPDVQTQELMKDFYTMVFVDGLSIPASLRKAMLNAIASSDPSRSHPAAWASFAYTGP